MKNAVGHSHPAAVLLYFTLVVGIGMTAMHPWMLGTSLAASLACAIAVNGRRALRFFGTILLPVALITVAVNALFNHQGMTLLFMVAGNPVTLESVYFGLASAAMYLSMLLWFSCYNALAGSNHLAFLFGAAAPSLAMVLTMSLRLVPHMSHQLRRVTHAQYGMGRAVRSGSWLRRVRYGLRLLAILATWVFEDAVETADSMRARGYGLRGRTRCQTYRWGMRDTAMTIWIGVCSGALLAAALAGLLDARYFPSPLFPPPFVPACAAYAGLCLTPLFIALKEEVVWRSLQSRI